MKIPGTYWQVYFGILADSTREWNQREFYVYVPELSPFHNGDITTEYTNQKIDLENVGTGSREQTSVQVTRTVKAEYMGVESSKSVPTMVKGQQVLVFEFASTGKFYWMALERDDHLKTFERVRLSCANIATTNKTPSASPTDIKAKKDGLTNENTYYLEIDTKDKKLIQLATSSSDGEPWRYYIKMDPVAKCIELWDEHSVDKSNPDYQPPNVIKLESRPLPNVRGKITLQNASGTTIELEDKNLKVVVPGNVTVDVTGDVHTNVSGKVYTNIEGDRNTTIKQNEAIVIGKNRGIAIGVDDKLDVTGNKLEKINKNYTVETILTFSEKQQKRVSTTLTDNSWMTNTWKLTSTVSMDIITATRKQTIGNDTLVTQVFSHTSSMANIRYASIRNIIIPRGKDPIPLKMIV